MRSLSVVLLTALFMSAPVAAFAEDPIGTRLITAGDAGVIRGQFGETPFTRGTVGASAEYFFTRRLSIRAGLGAGFLRLGFDHRPAAGLTTRGIIMVPFEASGRVGAAFAVLAEHCYRLSLIGELEASLPGSSPEITDLSITTPDGAFDVSSFAKDSAKPAIFWRRVSFGADFRVRLGAIEPMLGIAFEKMDAAIDLRMTSRGKTVLRSLGYADAIERRYASSQGSWLIPMRAGLAYHVGGHDLIEIGGMIAPGGGPVLGAHAGYAHSW